MVDLAELLALADRLATEAAALVVAARRQGLAGIETKTTATDLVTDMDRAAEALITAGLRRARPGDAVVGEEGAASRGSTGITWFVDPIDGTTNYVYGLAGFAVSLAAHDEEGPLVGVVVDPLRGDTYRAERGAGSTCNGRMLRCSDRDDLAGALVATGFSYESARRRRQAEVLTKVLPAVRDIRRLGAASVDLCLVGAGRVDAYYERGLQPWDKAAGLLVAAEAGARFEDRSSGLVIVAAPGLFDPLRALLVASGADDA